VKIALETQKSRPNNVSGQVLSRLGILFVFFGIFLYCGGWVRCIFRAILILSFNIGSPNAFPEISYEWETIGYSKESVNTAIL